MDIRSGELEIDDNSGLDVEKLQHREAWCSFSLKKNGKIAVRWVKAIERKGKKVPITTKDLKTTDG